MNEPESLREIPSADAAAIWGKRIGRLLGWSAAVGLSIYLLWGHA